MKKDQTILMNFEYYIKIVEKVVITSIGKRYLNIKNVKVIIIWIQIEF